MSSYFDFDDDGSQQPGNSTCSKFATCESCVDYFGQGDVGCLWCNVPKDGSRSVIGGGLCVPRFRAQDSCEIGELQVKTRVLYYIYAPVFASCLLNRPPPTPSF